MELSSITDGVTMSVFSHSVVSDSLQPHGVSSVHGILQARVLEWVAISFSRGLPDPGMEPRSLASPALAGGFFTTRATWEP